MLYRLNNSIGSDLASIENIEEDQSEIETEILLFCTKHLDKVKNQLNKALQEDREKVV